MKRGTVYVARWRAKGRETGRCTYCAADAVEGRRKCQYHLDKHAEAKRLLRGSCESRSKALCECGRGPKLQTRGGIKECAECAAMPKAAEFVG